MTERNLDEMTPEEIAALSADDLAHLVGARQARRQGEDLALARAQAERDGKEPFDFERLQKLCDVTNFMGNIIDENEVRARFEYQYYVHEPDALTLKEFARRKTEQARWLT